METRTGVRASERAPAPDPCQPNGLPCPLLLPRARARTHELEGRTARRLGLRESLSFVSCHGFDVCPVGLTSKPMAHETFHPR